MKELKSRSVYENSEKFRDDFLSTLTPGIIKREDFIQWATILKKQKKYESFFNFFRQIQSGNRDQHITQLTDAFMSADIAMDFISTSFELLGHTGKNYVSDRDYVNFKQFGDSEKDEHQMRYIATLLVDLGICHVFDLEIEDYFVGIQVGLETHRRKNIGGTAFVAIVRSELESLVEGLKKMGYDIFLKEEEKIFYTDLRTSKKVDFCLVCNSKILGIEVNFYTTSGSKPTEIKRSYGQVNQELEKVGAGLVWVTDGAGYDSMKNSLKEARDIHKNIYNLNMLKESFRDDVIDFFR